MEQLELPRMEHGDGADDKCSSSSVVVIDVKIRTVHKHKSERLCLCVFL